MLPSNYIPISNDPNLLLVKRAVEWDSFVVFKKMQTVQLTVQCHYFKEDSFQMDSYGPEIVTQGLKPFEKTFFAKNERKVNPFNGKECKFQSVIMGQNPNGSQIVEDKWVDTQGNFVNTPMGQYDYFYNVIKNYPVIVDQLIAMIIAEEDNYYKSFNN